MNGRTVTNTRVIDNVTGSTIATIHPDPMLSQAYVELRTPNGAVIGTCLNLADAILFHLDAAGY